MTQQLEVRQGAAVILPFRQSQMRASVRFPVCLELTIQTSVGDFVACTENVSANGLLFVCEHLPLLDDAIEFTMVMPSAVLGTEKDVRVQCSGRIVRRERGRHDAGLDETRAAVMIDEYHLKV